MKSRLFYATMLALLVGLFTVIPVAFAAGTNDYWAPFDCAKWVNGAGTNGTYGLVTTSNSTCSDGGLYLKAVPGNITNPNLFTHSRLTSIPTRPEGVEDHLVW